MSCYGPSPVKHDRTADQISRITTLAEIRPRRPLKSRRDFLHGQVSEPKFGALLSRTQGSALFGRSILCINDCMQLPVVHSVALLCWHETANTMAMHFVSRAKTRSLVLQSPRLHEKKPSQRRNALRSFWRRRTCRLSLPLWKCG
jgi:hypothetical protein